MSDWTLDGRFGAEIWREAEGRLVPASVAGRVLEGAADAALLERLGVRDTRCAHPGPFPNGFRFCPRCGASLGEAPAPDRSAPWSPPFGDSSGLPERELPLRPDPATMEEIALPPGAVALAVAGAPSRLLCCDRSSGWVFAYSGRDADWHRLLRVPPCATLPRWSWAASASHGGVALPTERGPVWVDLLSALDAPVSAPEESCASLGGPTRLGGAVIAPVSYDGGLAVAVLSGSAWEILPVSDAEAARAPFAVPVCGVDSAFWCSSAGQLAVRDTGDGFEARFSLWSDGVSPLLEARPVAGRDGTLHMPARLDRETLVWETLFAPNQPRGRRMARGYMPSTGRAVFRENALLRLPWDERPICDYPLEDDRFLYPLLSLGENRFVLALCNDRGRLGAFLGDPLFPAAPDAPPLVCTLLFSRGPRMLEPLDCVLRAHRASDLSATLHGRFLLIHGALDNRCFRWRLRDEE